MTSSIDQLLSEYMDAWTAGRRPELEQYLARAAPDDRAELAQEISDYLAWAPQPAYDEQTVAAMAADPLVQGVYGAVEGRRTLWPQLLPALRKRASWTLSELAGRLTAELVLGPQAIAKTERYLSQMESGTLPPHGVKPTVFDALGRLFGISAQELRAAGSVGKGWQPGGAFARAADVDAAPAALTSLNVVADLLSTPAPDGWDEVDELFRGGA